MANPVLERVVYVISDLHLGGNPNVPEIPGGRGFRMCSQGAKLASFIQALAAKPRSPRIELVILGDFVDFLAEGTGKEPAWAAFRRDPDDALKTFLTIANVREPAVFDALKLLLDRGHALTILLGNHDIELALPSVRQALIARLGAEDSPLLRFLYDGEAYAVGDALLEHGERLDTYNYVDHARLGVLRASQTRKLDTDAKPEFQAPTGSRIVAGLMNPIKQRYPFVDLLKPENQAAVPILLALDPSQVLKLRALAGLTVEAKADAVVGSWLGLRGKQPHGPTLAAPPGTAAREPEKDASRLLADQADPLFQTLLGVMTESEAREFIEALEHAHTPPPPPQNPPPGLGPTLMSSGSVQRGMGDWFKGKPTPEKATGTVVLSALHSALKAWLMGDETFSYDTELDQTYLKGAKTLAEAGHRLVIFGHTHLAKCQPLPGIPGRAWYMNSGTWADLIRFPEHILHGEKEQAVAELSDFMEDMRAGRLSAWIFQRPSYLKLEVSGKRVVRAALCEYGKSSPDPDGAGNEVAKVG